MTILRALFIACVLGLVCEGQAWAGTVTLEPSVSPPGGGSAGLHYFVATYALVPLFFLCMRFAKCISGSRQEAARCTAKNADCYEVNLAPDVEPRNPLGQQKVAAEHKNGSSASITFVDRYFPKLFITIYLLFYCFIMTNIVMVLIQNNATSDPVTFFYIVGMICFGGIWILVGTIKMWLE